eukprot:scaffold23105_cov79-Phaeocystis_antarctica.AAC.1
MGSSHPCCRGAPARSAAAASSASRCFSCSARLLQRVLLRLPSFGGSGGRCCCRTPGDARSEATGREAMG